MTQLVDSHGRRHRELRVSLTDRCSLRCTYCLPEEFNTWLPGDEILTVDELVTVAAVACSLGVDAIRLTGGEPLLRPDIVEIVTRLAALPSAPELSMTTNALRLADLASPLAAAGLHRVNISIDTLQADRFYELTKRARLDDVLAGIDAAIEVGFNPVKLNAVLMRGVNDDEAVDLLAFAIERGLQLRFIEQMPLDAGHIWDRTSLVTADEIEAQLRTVYTLTELPDRGSSPAQEFIVDGGEQRVGIIGSVTRPFCGACDRIRLTADGAIRNCLFARTEDNLRSILRDDSLTPEQRNERIAAVITGSVHAKKAGHGIDSPEFLQPQRPMSAIGG